jgi:site-specific DNA-methyltransferase (adenine-specific)
MTEDIVLHCGDALEWLPTLASQSIEAICTDLPYGQTSCAWDTVIPFAPMWEQVRRVLKPRGVFVTTASQPFTSTLVMSNLEWFRCEWIARKPQGTGYLNANRQPMKNHESIVVFAAGQHTYNPQMSNGKAYRATRGAVGGFVRDKTVGGYMTVNDGMRYPLTVIDATWEMGLHPTQKPVALYAYLIRTYTNAGDTVLDFCMGSGTTGVAAIQEGRRFQGCELDEGYFKIAQRRIADAQARPRLFDDSPAAPLDAQMPLLDSRRVPGGAPEEG